MSDTETDQPRSAAMWGSVGKRHRASLAREVQERLGSISKRLSAD